MKSSFVIPCYRSERTIESVVHEIQSVMASIMEYEIVLVNDSSPDNTLAVLRTLAARHKEVKVIDLARNFGQHGAWMAGFNHASGDYIVILDDDGQSPVIEISKLFNKIDEGYDVVFSQYKVKQHSYFRNLGTWFNYYLTENFIGKPKDLAITNFCVMKRFVIAEVVKYTNPFPYLAGLILKATNKIANVEVDHRPRKIGRSGYNFGRLLALWLNGLTAFSIKPLRVATLVGFASAVVGFLFGLYIVYNKLAYPGLPVGYSSIMATILYIGGMIMVFLGIIGEYVGRIYLSINRLPQYVIREIINLEPIDKK